MNDFSIQYVVGIVTNKDKTVGAFLRKNRPEWQKGKLNGFGGKIESGEAPVEAMVREFYEEAGVQTANSQWQYLGKFFKYPSFCVHAYSLSDDCFEDITQTEEEEIVWSKLSLDELQREGVPNLAWLVAMALDPDSFTMEVLYG